MMYSVLLYSVDFASHEFLFQPFALGLPQQHFYVIKDQCFRDLLFHIDQERKITACHNGTNLAFFCKLWKTKFTSALKDRAQIWFRRPDAEIQVAPCMIFSAADKGYIHLLPVDDTIRRSKLNTEHIIAGEPEVDNGISDCRCEVSANIRGLPSISVSAGVPPFTKVRRNCSIMQRSG